MAASVANLRLLTLLTAGSSTPACLLSLTAPLWRSRPTLCVCVCVCVDVFAEVLQKFRRESDRKRHKCVAERRKPISEQHGAIQCTACSRWFRSRGGLAVHTCRPEL